MKRFTLLFCMVCIGALTFGQTLQTKLDALGGSEQYASPAAGPVQVKGGGDLIWGTSFNWENPNDTQGWTLPGGWTVIDNSDLGNNWIWRKDSIVHHKYRAYTYAQMLPPSWFMTADDGYICMPLADYNNRDGISTSNLVDGSITTPPINCTGVSSVAVRFNQYAVFCCSDYNLKMQVTNDAGEHWATYDVRYNVTGNILIPEKYGRVEINITDVAAGQPNVQIRFYMHGFSHYFWAIDDLQLVEAYANNLILEDTWMDFDGGAGATTDQINFWPKSQMGMAGATSGTVGSNFFKAAFLNGGTADAEEAQLNLKILRNGSEVLNVFSESKSIWTLERDTFKITEPWLATEYGDYRVDFNAVNDVADELPANNIGSLYFTVDDSIAQRPDKTVEATVNTGGWTGGGNGGDMMTVNYNLYAPAELNSITAYIATFTPAETPQFQYVMLKEIEGELVEWNVTDIVDMDSSLMNTWVTLPIQKDGEIEFLEPGVYYAGVKMWGVKEGDADGTQGMTIGRDLTTKFSGCPQYYATDASWHNLAGSPLCMIGFNINETGGPSQAPATFNVDMTKHIASGEFKPGTDFVDVSGSFNGWTGSAHLTDADADGIYTITIEGMPVNSVIEYKYRINGNWSTSEYPNGGPNRKYTVRYWNVLNDVYNSGNTTGINPTSLVASFSVYPNPTSGSFTVDMTNTVPCNLEISLTNIQGQVVYRNTVSNVTTHQETIDTELAKGLYFLSVNNGREVKVQKVVKQ